jgi:hypothetical protein
MAVVLVEQLAGTGVLAENRGGTIHGVDYGRDEGLQLGAEGVVRYGGKRR